MKIEIRRLDQIKPYEKNARKIPQRAIDKVAVSLKEYGWQQPIVVDKDGVIVVGHVRRLGALQHGWTEAPVTVFEGTTAQAKAYRLMDNRSHQEADWDLDLLGPELTELSELSFDLSLTGFDPGEIDKFLSFEDDEKADDAPPLPESPVSRPGDLWLLGQHRALCGDATDTGYVACLLGGRKPILLVSDPPYGASYDPEWRKRAGLNNSDRMGKVSNDDRADWREAWALFPGDVAYVWHGALHAGTVAASLEACHFQIRSQVI